MKSTKQDLTVQQLACAAGGAASVTEGFVSGACATAAVGLMGAAGAVGTTTTICGWVPPVGIAGACLTGGLFL